MTDRTAEEKSTSERDDTKKGSDSHIYRGNHFVALMGPAMGARVSNARDICDQAFEDELGYNVDYFFCHCECFTSHVKPSSPPPIRHASLERRCRASRTP